LAKKVDIKSKEFNFEMQFAYEYNYLMHPVLKAFLGILITAIIIGGSLGTLLYLQLKEIINIRIPKPLRVGWFKDYISPEELEIIRLEEEKRLKFEKEQELMQRLAIKPLPTGKGFQISDSMFSDAESKMSKDCNPNIGFDQHGAITQFVIRKNRDFDKKSADLSGIDDTSNRYKSDKEFESLENYSSFDKKETHYSR